MPLGGEVGMSDNSAEESPDRNEGGGDRRLWTTPTVTEHGGLVVEGGAVYSGLYEDPFYHT